MICVWVRVLGAPDARLCFLLLNNATPLSCLHPALWQCSPTLLAPLPSSSTTIGSSSYCIDRRWLRNTLRSVDPCQESSVHALVCGFTGLPW